MNTTNRILLLSIAFGIAGWVFAAIVDYLFYYSGPFFDLLLFSIPPEEYLIRIVVVILFVAFGLIMIKFISPLETKIANHKLKNNEYENLLNLSQDIIVGLDREGVVNIINDKGCEIIECKREEILGKNWFENFVPSRIKYELQKGFESLIVGEPVKMIYYESSVKTRDGREKFIHWHNSVVTDLDGVISGTLSAGIDVTSERFIEREQKKLAIRLEEQAKLLEAILLSAPDLIFLWDKDGNFTYANFQAAQAFGMDRLDMTGKNWKELNLPEPTMTTLEAKRKFCLLSGNSLTDEILIHTIAGPRDYEYILTPIKNPEGLVESIIFSARDITERKTNEIELIETKKKVVESDRLKTEFLSQMSHEIRTPLHTILSYISLLKDELLEGRSDNIEHNFNSIDIGSKRLVRTIEMILNMSQMHTGSYMPEFTEVDLSKDILAAIINEASGSIQNKKLQLLFEEESTQAIVKLDQYTGTQIFKNLIDNALKYTIEGSIKVKVYKNENDKIAVDVEDTGIGISEKYLNKLFQPFSQEESGFSRRYEGNGLGLALAKKYCDLNNADISVKSEKGKGSIFTVQFRK